MTVRTVRASCPNTRVLAQYDAGVSGRDDEVGRPLVRAPMNDELAARC